jgi:hypothetical protein
MLSVGSNLHDRLQPKNKDGLADEEQHKQVTDGHYQIEPQSGDRLMSTENLLTHDDLAVRIRSTGKTVANRYYRAPEDFPPVLKVPGCRGPRFRPQDVDVWISGLAGKTENRSTKLPLSVPPPSDHAAAKRPRGRPRLASVAQRQKMQSGHQKTGGPARSQTGPRWPLPGLNADDTPILAEGGAK